MNAPGFTQGSQRTLCPESETIRTQAFVYHSTITSLFYPSLAFLFLSAFLTVFFVRVGAVSPGFAFAAFLRGFFGDGPF